MNLSDIEKVIADHQPPPEPFNGATRLFLSPDLHAAIMPLMSPMDRRRIAVDERPMLSPGHGCGFRPTRDGDPEWSLVPGYGTMVWACAPDRKPCLACGGPESDHVANYYCSEFQARIK